ncbi:MAG TPA: hypothetical protein PLK94_14450, partial [Alphaproteobacteria bacterium]|nr:hypothetical protein [Alphaproteobacteria bacterium]
HNINRNSDGTGTNRITAEEGGAILSWGVNWNYLLQVGAPRSDGVNGAPRSSTQTEMQNMGVNYIIKY